MKNILILMAFFICSVVSAQSFIKGNNLYVYPHGSVGIGTLTPLSILDVTGTGTLLSAMIVPRDTSANRPGSPVNGMIRYNTSTSGFEGYANSAWGALGGGGGGASYIGSGTGLLGGPITATGTLSVDPGVVFEQNGNAFGTLGAIGTTDGNPMAMIANNQIGLEIDQLGNVSIGRNNQIYVSNSGNVGIGTVNPTFPLEVSSVAQIDGILYINNGGSLGQIVNTSTSPASSMLIIGNSSDGAGNLEIQATSACGLPPCSDYINFLTANSSERMRIADSGNIGIGTTTPNAILDIVSSGTSGSIIIPRGSSANRSAAAINGMIRYNTSTSAFEGYQNSSWQNLISAGSANAFVNNGNAFGASGLLGTTDNNILSLEANSIKSIYLDQLGNVGIGTASAIYVNGASRVGIGTLTPRFGSIVDMAGIGTALSSIIVPRDTTASRPGVGLNGMLRYNTNTASFEGYANNAWGSISQLNSSGNYPAADGYLLTNLNGNNVTDWFTSVTISGADPSIGVTTTASLAESTSASWTLTNNFGLTAGIPCASGTTNSPSTSTTCVVGGANGSTGFSITVPQNATVKVCANFSLALTPAAGIGAYCGDTVAICRTTASSSACASTGTGILQIQVGDPVAASDPQVVPFSFCSFFSVSSGLNTFRLENQVSTSGGNCTTNAILGDLAVGGRNITFDLTPIR